MRIFLGVFLALLVLSPAKAETRIALIIGNSDYAIADLRLPNPVNDAGAMERALKDAGFETILIRNAKRQDIYRKVEEFSAKIARDPNAVGLFYYAGHGVQVDGVNYLIPVDAEIESDADLDANAYDAGKVLRAMKAAQNQMNIVILDACRDNPLPKARGVTRGLAKMDAPGGTFIAYAAAPGQEARDGAKGTNGVFTGELVKAISEPGVPLEQMFKKVISGVMADTQGKQEPWSEASIRGEFYFHKTVTPGPTATAPVTAAPMPGLDPRQLELTFWESIKDSRDVADFHAYLQQFPKGVFASLATNRMKLLESAPSPTPQPVAALAAPKPATPSASSRQPGQVFRDVGDGPEMVVIPAGSFTMGSSAAETTRESSPNQFANSERPQHDVSVRSFAIGKYAVTRGEFATFIGETGYNASGCFVYDGAKYARDASKNWRDPGFEQSDRHPAVCISYDDAQHYVAWLNGKVRAAVTVSAVSGDGPYRLPSEAEWEYAARAGTTTARYWGDSASNQCDYANGGDQTYSQYFPQDIAVNRDCFDGYVFTASAGSFRPNPWGLYDMLGNALQWTADCWNENYSGAPTNGSAWTSGTCGERVVRGGSWLSAPGNLRAAHRGWRVTDNRFGHVGFRLARTLP